MTKSAKIDLAPTLVSSLIMFAGGLIAGVSWPFILFAGLAVGLTTNDGRYTYFISLFVLAFWLFVSGYTELLEYEFPFPPQAKSLYKIVYTVNPDRGFDILAWILILLSNWLGVFLGKRAQKLLIRV